MRRRIQNSMSLVVCIALVLNLILFTVISYNQSLEKMRDEVQNEAHYISQAVHMIGPEYLQQAGESKSRARITLIGADGDIVYDSVYYEIMKDNHADRAEVKEALDSGSGEDTRLSHTALKNSYYYAIRLDDGSVLRVSQTTDTVWGTVGEVLLPICLIGAGLLVLSLLIARWETSRMIQPINELDIKDPLKNKVYEELTPLLHSIERQNQEKENVSQMRKEFTANVSHELKSPLTSISGYAELLMNGLVKPEDVPEFAERIYQESSRMITLIEDIIKLSKLDEESIELEKEAVDLFELAEEACIGLKPYADQKQVSLELTGQTVIFRGIKAVLGEMIYNICENAIKYNKPGGSVKIWAGNTLEGAKVIVSDTGIGIPAKYQERVFERFYRVDKSHSRKSGGTGLGLSIVKHGAILHHAEVKLTSEPGKGTQIEICFK